MSLTKEAVLAALSAVQHPGAGKDVVSAGAVAKCTACDNYVAATLQLAGLPAVVQQAVRQSAESAIRAAAARAGEALNAVSIDVSGAPADAAPTSAPPVSRPLPQAGRSGPGAGGAGGGGGGGGGSGAAPSQASAPVLPGVRHVVAVGAGKGGVGKSTIAVNLAVGLARRGHSVGILDGDIYGPSLPTMLGLHALQTNIVGGMLQPFPVHGVKAMSIGKLVDPEKALIWRGPMAHGAFKQLVEQTSWGELDYLIIDLPPGTGDVSLTLAQLLRLTGAVVVCTPQRVAQDDCVRAVRMFQQLGIDVLGVVENMSYFIADDLPPSVGPREYDLFGRGGAQQMAQRLGVPFLGAVPVTIGLRQRGDEGDPSGNFEPEPGRPGPSALTRALEAMVANLEAQVALAGFRVQTQTPTLTIS